MEPEFREWAAAQQLTEETISILIENGVDSCTALSAFTTQDLPDLGPKLGQMALVRRLINADAKPCATAAPSALSIVRTLQVSFIRTSIVLLMTSEVAVKP
jgi:hypothetical protein